MTRLRSLFLPTTAVVSGARSARDNFFLPLLALASVLALVASRSQVLPQPVVLLLVGACTGALVLYLYEAWRWTRHGFPPEFEFMLEAAGNPLLIGDDQGRIVALNQAAATLFGYHQQELHGRSLEILMPERFRDSHRAHRAGFAQKAERRAMGMGAEFVALRRDGTEFPVEIALHPISARTVRYTAATVHDVSDRRESDRIRQQLSAILENTTDFVGMANAEGQVYYINTAGREMLGISSPADRPTIATYLTAAHYERLERDGLPFARSHGVWSGETEFQHCDGHGITVSLTILAHRRHNGEVDYYSAVARDITGRRRDEEKLRRVNRTYAVLSRCNHILTRAVEEQDLARDFCTALVETGGYRLAWFGMAKNDKGCSVIPVVHAGDDDGYLQTAHISWCGTDPHGNGPVGRAIREDSITVARDTENDPLFAPWRTEALRRGFRSVISLPIHDEGARPCGALNIYAADVDAFDSEELALLAELAGDLGFGIRTLRTRRAGALAESLSQLRNQVIEASRNGVLITDGQPDYPIVYVNAAFEQITGYSRDETLGRSPSFLLRGDHGQTALEAIRTALRQGRDGSATLRNYRKDGTLFWNDLFITPVRDEQGHITHFAGIINDITERKLYEEQLEYQANHDLLTGLPSRSLMRDRLVQALSASIRHGRQLGVLFLDLDQFKFVNDSLGHGTGDELLKIAADRLRSCIRDGDTLSRYGGDEFVLLLPDIERPETVSLVAQRILQTVAQPLTIEGHQLQSTISIGASLFPRDGSDAETLLKNADAAMYRAKELGRNNIQFYTAELNERAHQRLKLEAELRRAIERDELVLHYQPRVDLRTGRIVGTEALVRWQHPELGLVPPAAFIGIAEETGLIVPLGDWVLATACAQNRSWQQAGLPSVVMAVNVSARQLGQAELPARIEALLQDCRLEPEELELELTESAIMDDPEAMLRQLQLLKNTGAQLSMDDFGTGYSSLSHLSAFPFDSLKIDQSFIRNVTSSPHDAEIALAIIALAHSLKLNVIAEGVETEGQLRYLQRHGCDEFQGYYFSRPVPADELAQMLREGKVLGPVEEGRNGALPTVLLVDDDPSVLAALRRMLHRETFRIVTASSAREAFEILALTNVEVVVSDQGMPEITGVEFLSRVKELYPETVRMVLSASGDQRTVMDAFNRGEIYRFFLKPWEDGQLRREIREAVRRVRQDRAPRF